MRTTKQQTKIFNPKEIKNKSNKTNRFKFTYERKTISSALQNLYIYYINYLDKTIKRNPKYSNSHFKIIKFNGIYIYIHTQSDPVTCPVWPRGWVEV